MRQLVLMTALSVLMAGFFNLEFASAQSSEPAAKPPFPPPGQTKTVPAEQVPPGTLGTGQLVPPAKAIPQNGPGQGRPTSPPSNGGNSGFTAPAQAASSNSAFQASKNVPPAAPAAVPVPSPLPDNSPPREMGGAARTLNSTQTIRSGPSSDSLPNSAGQVWREYDISPYTSQIKTVDNPQQAILDWILQETGTNMWFNSPMGILSAERNRLMVYHTPEIQAVVQPIIDRFIKSRGQVQAIDINLVTVGDPNWRAEAYALMQPIKVRSSGVEAWLVSKENAALILSNISKRGDFRQHSAGRLTAHDGQKLVIKKSKPVQFIQSIQWLPNRNPSFQPNMTQIDEGYSLTLSSLSSLDKRTIEATIKCQVEQVEELRPVAVPVPGMAQPVTIQVPQLVSWRLHERFRWPADHVLIMSCGVVATPDPQAGKTFSKFFGRGGRSRADALLFIEYRGPATGSEQPAFARGRNMAPLEIKR